MCMVLPGLGADTRKVFAVEQLIDDRALTDIGFACKDDLRQRILRKIAFLDRRAQKLHVVQVNRWFLLLHHCITAVVAVSVLQRNRIMRRFFFACAADG